MQKHTYYVMYENGSGEVLNVYSLHARFFRVSAGRTDDRYDVEIGCRTGGDNSICCWCGENFTPLATIHKIYEEYKLNADKYVVSRKWVLGFIAKSIDSFTAIRSVGRI